MKCVRTYLFLVAALTVGTCPAVAQQSLLERLEHASPQQVQKLLERFPQADANQDGTLTRSEAVAYAREKLGTTQKTPPARGIAPTHANVAYGPHGRNTLDFWQAEGTGPRPLVIFIHGGGFVGGDKSKWHDDEHLRQLLSAGVSCAAINYRFIQHAPIQDILHDAALAVQVLRSRAADWQLDPNQFAAWGGSAGAGTSLWLASRDDLADPSHEDPVRHQSSRVQAAVLNATQATYDLTRWDAFLGPADATWRRGEQEPAFFYHVASAEQLQTPEGKAVLRECDMLAWIDTADAPVFVSNPGPDTPPTNRNQYVHHPAHAREIQKACDACGVACHWKQGPTPCEFQDPLAFVLSVFEIDELNK